MDSPLTGCCSVKKLYLMGTIRAASRSCAPCTSSITKGRSSKTSFPGASGNRFLNPNRS